jgi:subtilisin-like proprotein convertase family protein
VEDVMAAFVISMARVNGVYERDANLTMVLIPNNDDLIFLNGTTDPYTNNNIGTLINENQTTIDGIIGFDNYDIGHLFSTTGSGLAQLRAPCNGGKARGVTGLGSPIGDPFWIDYVAHEMGHQYGGNHTQNNSCNRAGAAAVEPGSASTIMGYAGICNPNVQNNSDDHFHAYNLAEFAAFLNGAGGTCPELSPTGNIPPTVIIEESSYIVPISTSLVLTATAADEDVEDVLSYCWEQMDSEVGETMPPAVTNTQGPAFRSNSPVISPNRYLPGIEAIVANVTPDWEVLPAVSREMSWRCTIRDNSDLEGGCTSEVDLDITFTDEAGPLVVNQPNTSDVIWRVAETVTIEWDVANTDIAPVNATTVDLYLSTDGGLTYPTILATEVDNNGSAQVVVPDMLTEEARVMVRGHGNIFFDISNENFSILEPLEPTFTMVVNPLSQVGCIGEEAIYEMTINSILDYDEEVAYTIEGAPPGLSASFQSVTTGSVGTNSLILNGFDAVDRGVYTITIVGTSIDRVRTQEVELILLDAIQPSVLEFPENGATLIDNGNLALTWEVLGGEEEFLIEISTSPAFVDLVATTTTVESIYDIVSLEANTVYYWRVRGQNQCEVGEFSETFAFQTKFADICSTFSTADNLPFAIPPDVISTIDINEALIGDYIKVNIDMPHEYVGDMTANLYDPVGNLVVLFDQPGINNSQFGCPEANMLVSIYDSAPNTAEVLANTCDEGGQYAIQGDYQPVDNFAAYEGSDVNGTWSLELIDDFLGADDGTLDDWTIEVCNIKEVGQINVTENKILEVPLGQSTLIGQQTLETSGDAELVTYTITSLPSKGSVELEGVLMTLGSTFTQSDINGSSLVYVHSGIDEEPDSFTFDIVDDTDSWLQGGVQEIIILNNDLSGSAEVTNNISCANAADGEITIMVEGGNLPLTYILGNTTQDSPVFTGLIAGTYEIEVVDVFGFEITISDIIITEPTELTVSTDVDFNNISVNAEGGTEPYTYLINGGNDQSNNTFSNLSNGTYQLGVIDANGCEASETITLIVEGLQVELILENRIDCFGDDDGVIRIEASEGFPPYEYRIVGQPWQESNVFEDLAAGSYTFRIRDSDGNIIDAPFTLEEPEELVASVEVTFNSIEVIASGGTGELMYMLNGGDSQSGNIFSNLDNGSYGILVTDENGCAVSVSTAIDVADLTMTAESVINVTCFGDNDGSLDLVASGGIPPYRYRIVGGPGFQDNPSYSGLSAGDYVFRVRDASNGIFNLNVTIEEPDAINVTAAVDFNNVSVTATGGTGTFMYQLDNTDPQQEDTYTGLENGDYTVIVTDTDGCIGEATFTIDVDELTATAAVTQEIRCHDEADGIIEVTAMGGVPPYSFSIDGTDFQDSPIFTSLQSGFFEIIIRDAAGNVEMTSVEVVNPEEIILTANTVGSDIIVDATGGTGELTYSIDGITFTNSNEFTNVADADYTIIVMDSNGCQAQLNVTVAAFIDFDITVIDVTCFGDEDGVLVIDGQVGGIAPFTYVVDDIEYISGIISGLSAGDHVVTVFDSNGSSIGPRLAVIGEPDEIIISTDLVVNDLTVTATGGTGNLEYSIDNGDSFQDSGDFPNLESGDFMVVVRDENGCLSMQQVIITISNTDDQLNNEIGLQVYPIPSSGNVNLVMTNVDLAREVQIQVLNHIGQVVFDQTNTSGQSEYNLDLTHLTDGQYLIKVVNDSQIGVERIVILQ